MIQTDNYSLNEFEDKINGIYNGRECVYNAAKTKIKSKMWLLWQRNRKIYKSNKEY